MSVGFIGHPPWLSRDTGLWTWADDSFEKKTLSNTYTLEGAIPLAREADASDLFEHSNDENEEELLGMRRGAVAATAAIVLNFREGRTQEDLGWARDVLRRASLLSEKPDLMWSPRSAIPWHQAIYVARGLAADLLESTAAGSAAHNLLGLIAHPLEIVSLAALEEACTLWSTDPKLTWAALILAFSLCHVPRPRDQFRQPGAALHSSSEAQAAVDIALASYENGSGWASLQLPPPAWVRVELADGRRGHQRHGEYDVEETADTPAGVWREPDIFWHSTHAAEILKRIPFDEVLSSSARGALLDFLAGALDWTNQKTEPPWLEPGRENRSEPHIFEWTAALGSALGRVAGILPLSDFRGRFLDPILALEGDNCWALLSPFASAYVCAYVYDAPVVPPDAVATLDLCLGRLLRDSAFKRDAYRGGEFSGSHQPQLARTLMLVSVERADLAARYVNGDWSDIGRVLPLIDRFVRASGWAASVMDLFLTLCERAKANYPADAFADQVLTTIGDGPDNLKGWHGTDIPARIAELVQHFASRDTPMRMDLAQKFLRILDRLVDMGDRRSAALQAIATCRGEPRRKAPDSRAADGRGGTSQDAQGGRSIHQPGDLSRRGHRREGHSCLLTSRHQSAAHCRVWTTLPSSGFGRRYARDQAGAAIEVGLGNAG
jgi:hypothetical protein